MTKDYLDKNSKCINHPDVEAIYYNWDEKWLCKECLEKEFKRLNDEVKK